MTGAASAATRHLVRVRPRACATTSDELRPRRRERDQRVGGRACNHDEPSPANARFGRARRPVGRKRALAGTTKREPLNRVGGGWWFVGQRVDNRGATHACEFFSFSCISRWRTHRKCVTGVRADENLLFLRRRDKRLDLVQQIAEYRALYVAVRLYRCVESIRVL